MTTEESPTAQFRTFLESMKGLSAKRVGEIVEEFERHLPDAAVRGLLVDSARVTVETVEIYGLEIEVDANGRAGRVGLAETTPGVWDTLTVEYYA